MHLGERYKALHLWNWDKHGLVDPAIKSFDLLKMTVQSKSDIRRVTEHLKITEQSRSFGAYSAKKKRNYCVFTDFGIAKDMKIILCALSSTDEIYSGFVMGKIPLSRYEGVVFQTQFDWIRETIKVATEHSELFFIIRLHPRMVGNKRELVTSPDVARWQELLTDLPKNMAVDYPEKKRSISNYFDQIDLLVTGWSSTAIDAMSKGIPALSYDESISWFPPGVVDACTNIRGYELKLLSKLQEGRRKENCHLAYNWLIFRLIAGTVPVPGRFIDRLSINNRKITEKAYAFALRYLFEIIARAELLTMPRKKQKLPLPVRDLLSGKKSALH